MKRAGVTCAPRVSEKIHIRTACEHALRPGARVVSVDDGTPELSANNLVELTALAERGAITPVIDRRYPLAQIVEAHRYVDQGHKRGNVVISILPDGELGP